MPRDDPAERLPPRRHETQYETAPQAQTEDLERAHDVTTPMNSQSHMLPADWSPESVHWSQILGRAPHSQVAQPHSPLALGSQLPPSQVRPLNSQALHALSQQNPGGSQVQERSGSPVPSAYLPPEEAYARMAARAVWGPRYDEALERAYGRVPREDAVDDGDPYAADYGLDPHMVTRAGQDDARSRYTNSTQRLLSQSSAGSQGPRRPSQESLPARASQVLGPHGGSPRSQEGLSQRRHGMLPPAAPQEDPQRHSQSSQSQVQPGHLPTPAHTQQRPPAPIPGPSRLAAVPEPMRGPSTPMPVHERVAGVVPPPETPANPNTMVLKLTAKTTRKPKGPPPFAFTPCPPPREPSIVDPPSEHEPDPEPPADLPTSHSEPAPVVSSFPTEVPRALRIPRRPSETIVPDSQEERERREREAREREEAALMAEWDRLKTQRRVRIESQQSIAWAVPLPHEWPVPTRGTVLAAPDAPAAADTSMEDVSSPEPGYSIMGSLPTDPESFARGCKELAYKEYHDSQQCTQEQWPATQPSAPRQQGGGMEVDQYDIFTNPDPLYYGFRNDDGARPPLSDPTPRDGKSKKQAIMPVPRPLPPYDRASAEAFLCSPHGRCAWVVPVRGSLGFGCSPASMLVPPDARFAVTPWGVLASGSPPREPEEPTVWTQAFSADRLRAALRALPQMIASSPATSSSFQDAPGELVWTADALRGFWDFVLLMRRAARVGLVGVRFVVARTGADVADDTNSQDEDEHARRMRDVLAGVDHVLLELDARYAMTVRYLLDVWRYECTLPPEIVALRRIRERLTGSDGDRERNGPEKDSRKGKGKERAPDVEMGDDAPEDRGMKRKRVDSHVEGDGPSTVQEQPPIQKTRSAGEQEAEDNLERAVTPLQGAAPRPLARRETREERMKRMNHSSRRMFHGVRLLLLDASGRPLLVC